VSTDRRTPAGRLALPAAAIVLAALVYVQVRLIHLPTSADRSDSMITLISVWWALLLLGVFLLLRALPRRLALGLLVAGALALPVVAFTRGPQISTDLYRYAWDGRVQAAGIDPYRYTPVDPALAHLRDPWLFPDPAGCATPPTTVTCTRINYRNAHTVYPPVGEAWFTLVHYLPGPGHERQLQLWADVTSLGLVGLIAVMLRASGRDERFAALYAWSPLAGIDVGSDAHVDALAALLTLGAFAVLMKRRPGWAGGLLGAAIAVKLYPALVLPAALRRHPLRVLGAAIGLVALSYVPHVFAVGGHVIGFLPSYLSVEGYNSGGRFLLLRLIGLHGTPAKVAAAAILLTVAWLAYRSSAPPTRGALWIFGAALLVATPVQPWYAVTLVALAAVEGRWEWVAVAAAGYPLYFQPTDALKTDVGSLSFGVALACVAAVAAVRRWKPERLHRRAASARRQELQPAVGGRPGDDDGAGGRDDGD
jgi:hypothetical protein